jgi:hypothetical protein
MTVELLPLAPGDQFTPSPHNGVPRHDALWDYTLNGGEIAAIRQYGEREEGRRERHTIGRDTPLIEGVYEGAYGGEAVVVDYENDPELIDIAVDRVLVAAKDPDTGMLNKGKLLQSVFGVVSNTMRYDSAAVDKIFKGPLGGQNGRKISLSAYIEEGVGECRHQALFAGTILERLKILGIVNGMVSIDRNEVRRGPDGRYDGHAWIRYTNSAGVVFILDVAGKRLMTLEDAMAQHAKDPSSIWDYARPEDRRRMAGRTVGKAVSWQNSGGTPTQPRVRAGSGK